MNRLTGGYGPTGRLRFAGAGHDNFLGTSGLREEAAILECGGSA
jgi:hypothetical protein